MDCTGDGTAPRLLTTQEVCAELRIGRTCALKLMDAGDLPFVRVGPRLRRVAREDLEAYLRQLRSQHLERAAG